MREIKFRAWDTRNKEMALPEFHLISFNGDVKDYHEGGWAGDADTIGDNDNLTLMQFTGLRDKNGKGDEIYNSDVIYDGYHKCNRKVVFDEGCYFADRIVPVHDGWSNRLTLSEALIPQDSKKIGNIYENPELLKGA